MRYMKHSLRAPAGGILSFAGAAVAGDREAAS